MFNKKRLFIIAGLLVIIIIAAVAFLLFRKGNSMPEGSLEAKADVSNLYIPEFMQAEEKARLGLPADAKIQILTKNESGETEVFRIIRRDADLVLDPTRAGDADMIQPKKTIEKE